MVAMSWVFGIDLDLGSLAAVGAEAHVGSEFCATEGTVRHEIPHNRIPQATRSECWTKAGGSSLIAASRSS
jgi:hypothetical protein